MNAETKLNAFVGRDLGIALDHRPLNFNGAVHCVDDTPELDNCAIAGAFDDAPMVDGDGRIDQVAAKGPKASKDSIFIRTSKPRVADHVGDQDRRELSGFAHGASAEAESPVAGGKGMAAFPCCTEERRGGRECRPGVRPVSLAALTGCVTPVQREEQHIERAG
jgi:hypothetical protein